MTIGDGAKCRIRLVDCVGYMVKGAVGHEEDNMPRMVRTPWSEEEMPFDRAAEIGTRKVITDHSTIGIVMTTDGSITQISREDYIPAEERVVNELKETVCRNTKQRAPPGRGNAGPCSRNAG